MEVKIDPFPVHISDTQGLAVGSEISDGSLGRLLHDRAEVPCKGHFALPFHCDGLYDENVAPRLRPGEPHDGTHFPGLRKADIVEFRRAEIVFQIFGANGVGLLRILSSIDDLPGDLSAD